MKENKKWYKLNSNPKDIYYTCTGICLYREYTKECVTGDLKTGQKDWFEENFTEIEKPTIKFKRGGFKMCIHSVDNFKQGDIVMIIWTLDPKWIFLMNTATLEDVETNREVLWFNHFVDLEEQ